MVVSPLAKAVGRLRHWAHQGSAESVGDGPLLEAFLSRGDEAAFERLVRRHAPMVLAVCRRVVGNTHDAEDAFQATFLVLVRKAACIVPRDMLGNWLHGVALRTALDARSRLARRRSREKQVSDMHHASHPAEAGQEELRQALDQELSRLPDKYRLPVVLCELEGRSRREVARQLGLPEGTLSSRLATARKKLSQRLARRGLAVAPALLAAALSGRAAAATMPVGLLAETVRVGLLAATGQAAGFVSAQVVTLAEGAVKSMFLAKLKVVSALMAVLALLGAGLMGGVRGLGDGGTALAAQNNRAAARKIVVESKPKTESPPPGSIFGRSGAAKAQALLQGGGDKESEAAIERGLDWLARQQRPDGSWPLDGKFENPGIHNDVAGTALGLLPFLGAGRTHQPGKDNPHDKVVKKGMSFLVRKQNGKTGDFGGGMYAHGLAAIALAEAYALTKDPALKRSAQQAINYIVRAQHNAGGWRYAPGQAGDTSVTVWQVMALTTARMGKLNVPEQTMKKARRYLDGCRDAANEGYGYIGPTATPGMTAAGLLCRQCLEKWQLPNPKLAQAVDNNIVPSPPGNLKNMYYVFHASEVMHHVGGKRWKTWNDQLRDPLIKAQIRDGAMKGSWSPVGDVHAGAGGRLMYTSFCLLTLEVYYRHMPLAPAEEK
jgi:RNA polymerase sigma factor (sigma-70 family)